MSTTATLLQENCEKLLAQYNANLEVVVALQAILIRDILPSVADELELSPEATEWAKAWLEDTYTLFRICREKMQRVYSYLVQRNDFTRSFAMESVRKILLWRIGNLWPLLHSTPALLTAMHCLPRNITSESAKPIIIEAFERLRCHLTDLNATSALPPIIQYVILLDVKDFSLAHFDFDLFTWIIREVIPRFSGMLGGVFVLNYSWVHGGIWSVIKHVLPESALSRVFFSSNEDVIQYFTPSSLPKGWDITIFSEEILMRSADYGGTLPASELLEDPLRIQEPTPHDTIAVEKPATDSLPVKHPKHPTSISPTSLLNPFFGYPASLVHGSLSLYHGRRRKRDLARTLFLLFWIRWRKYLISGFLLAISAVAFKIGARGAHVRHLRTFPAKGTTSNFFGLALHSRW